MRFVDSNVFIHAFLIPHRTLTEKEALVENEAKRIVKKIEEGENVALTVVSPIREFKPVFHQVASKVLTLNLVSSASGSVYLRSLTLHLERWRWRL